MRFLVEGRIGRLQNWHIYVQSVQFLSEQSPQIATNGMSPNEIIFGKSLETPLTIKTTLPQKTSIQRRLRTLETIRREVKEARDKAFNNYYNKGRKALNLLMAKKCFKN